MYVFGLGTTSRLFFSTSIKSFELEVYTTYDPQKIVCQQKSISLHLFLKFSLEVMDCNFQVQDCHMHFLSLFHALLFTSYLCRLQKKTPFISQAIHRKNFWMGYKPRELGYYLEQFWSKMLLFALTFNFCETRRAFHQITNFLSLNDWVSPSNMTWLIVTHISFRSSIPRIHKSW